MSAARDRWLDEGLVVLAAEGAPGIRIDRLAARLGLSKGSFHHHFDGAEGYKRALLDYVERLMIDALNDAIAYGEGQEDARSVLHRLTELVEPRARGLYRPELEVALRAWAGTDADAREVQARVDDARVAALQRVWRPAVASDAEAHTAALLPYLVAVGATVVTPPVAPDELRSIFRMLVPLIPQPAPPEGD